MSLPGAVRALGLGDIRIDSALNEPLSAQIDIVGATRDELLGLTAKVAPKDVFLRYGAERPSFLASATFKVGLDAHGRPVLNVRSAEPFSDPVVSFLVDLQWSNGELIREYSILLDPPGFSERLSANAVYAATPTSAAPAAAAAPRASAPTESHSPNTSDTLKAGAVTAHVAQSRAAQADADETTLAAGGQRYRVGPHDTLRAIVRKAGAHSESQAQRMMIAIYRANPHAFDGNINWLHLGATIDLPTAEQVDAVDTNEARREVRAQVKAWRMDGRPSLARRNVGKPSVSLAASVSPTPMAGSTPSVSTAPTPGPAPSVSAAPMPGSAPMAGPAPIAGPAQNTAAAAEPALALQNRLQSLEAELDDMHKQLVSENATIEDLKQRAANNPAVSSAPEQKPPAGVSVEVMHAAAAKTPAPAVAPAPAPQRAGINAWMGSLAAAVALGLAGFALVRRRALKPASGPQSGAVSPASEARYADFETRVNPVMIAQPPAVDHRLADTMPVEVLKSAQAESPSGVQATARHSPQEVAIDPEALEEALERSYLDALAIDTLGIDGAASKPLEDGEMHEHVESVDDAATNELAILDTVALDTSELAAAENPSGIHTTIIERQDYEPELAASEQSSATTVDYDLLDLDSTAEHIQHVQMPSQLHDQVVVSERRMNIVDVLKAAIDRDPNRRDLRMKLLETYYGTASTNRRAFLDLVKQLSREDCKLTSDDWKKIMAMGREIAADDIFFADPPKDDMAHCA